MANWKEHQPLQPVSPELQKHMADLTQWFKDRNLGGFVILSNGTHGEYKHMFTEPDWSCIKIEGKYLRMRAKRADYQDREDERQRHIHHTTDMLGVVKDLCGRTFVQCDTLLGMLKESGMQIETNPIHTPGGGNEDVQSRGGSDVSSKG